jgi:hypothetical protein
MFTYFRDWFYYNLWTILQSVCKSIIPFVVRRFAINHGVTNWFIISYIIFQNLVNSKSQTVLVLKDVTEAFSYQTN